MAPSFSCWLWSYLSVGWCLGSCNLGSSIELALHCLCSNPAVSIRSPSDTGQISAITALHLKILWWRWWGYICACACVCVRTHMHAYACLCVYSCAYVYTLEYQGTYMEIRGHLLGVAFLLSLWVLGIELRLSGLCGKHFLPAQSSHRLTFPFLNMTRLVCF